MAGSSAVFVEKGGEGQQTYRDTVKKIKCSWTSDSATGAVSGTTAKSYTGRFIGLITKPGVVGVKPSDNYTVTVTDEDGVDLLLGAATGNRDDTNTEFLAEASLGLVAGSQLTFNISGAGNSKQGEVYLLIK